MEKKKEHIRKPISAIALTVMVIIAMVVSACRNEYIYYKGHFKIEKVHMTRISIDDFPAEKTALYLMEVAYSDAPLDSIIYDGKLRMPDILPLSVDSITMVTFKNKGLLVHPNQIRWIPMENYYSTNVGTQSAFSQSKDSNKSGTTILCNNNDTVNASMYLQETPSNRTLEVTYLTDYRDLPLYIKSCGRKLGNCLFDNALPCSDRQLISFDTSSPLPDEAYIQLRGSKRIKVEIDNELKKFKLVRNVYYYHPRN